MIMKYIIIGFVISLSGIVLSIIEHQQLPAELDLQPFERPGLSYKKVLFPYMIPVGIFIVAIGLGELLSRQKKKKLLYNSPKSWCTL